MQTTIEIAQSLLQMTNQIVNWMFQTQLVPGFSIGVVFFGSAVMMMGVRFVGALLAKKDNEKDG